MGVVWALGCLRSHQVIRIQQSLKPPLLTWFSPTLHASQMRKPRHRRVQKTSHQTGSRSKTETINFHTIKEHWAMLYQSFLAPLKTDCFCTSLFNFSLLDQMVKSLRVARVNACLAHHDKCFPGAEKLCWRE